MDMVEEKKDLRQKATTGVIWSAVQKYSVTFITFVSDLILARLLLPEDFGCVEMLAIFMLLSGTIVNGGFGSALVQKKRPTQEDYSTIFFWNMGMAVLIYATLFFCAPSIARFYRTPLLSPVLRVQALVLLTNAFNIVQSNQLVKQFRFKTIAIVSVITNCVALGITILMAYNGFGVWSLVAKNMIASVLTSLIFWFYIKWRPTFVFSVQSFKELFSFGFYMFLSNLVTSFSAKLQGLLIGRGYNPSTVGYYAKASGTEGVISTTISQILDQVTYPLYAEAQDDLQRLGNIVKRLVLALAYVTFPIIFIMVLVAKPMFVLLYSERWLPSVPFFQILCIGGLAQCLQSVNFYTISAIGKSKITFVWTMIKRSVGMACIVGGMALFGIKGVLIGSVFNQWFAFFVNMGLVSKHIGYKWYVQLKDLFPVLCASIICALLSLGCARCLNQSMYIDGIIIIIVYAALYLGWTFLFKPNASVFLWDTINPIVKRMKHKRD